MTGKLGRAAMDVLKTDMCLTLIPQLRKILMDVARDVAYEESGDHADEFAVDLAASAVIKELAEYLSQSNLIVEDWAPLLSPHQLRKKYALAYWEVEIKK